MPNHQKFSMYSPTTLSFTSFSLRQNSEVVNWIYSDHPKITESLKAEDDFLSKISKSKSKSLLAKSQELVSMEAELITSRLKDFKKVNFVNLGEEGFKDSLELIKPLLQENILNKYIIATRSDKLNHQWIKDTKLFASSYQAKFESHPFKANFDLQSYSSSLKSLIDLDKDMVDLFFLPRSSLSKYLNPERVVKNIYSSMTSGDYLIVSQDIYREGSQNLWIDSYKEYLASDKNLAVQKELAKDLSKDSKIQVVWEDKQDFKGIKLRVKIKQPINFAKVNLKADQEVDIFRSAKFEEADLKNMFLDTSFQFIETVYDKKADTILLILQKS